MPSTLDLCRTIYDGDIARVQQIVAQLSNTDIDINDMPNDTTVIHLLFSARLDPALTEQILQIFLDLKDTAGNLLVDLNKVVFYAGSALTAAIETDNIDSVQQILDARNNDGSLAVNLLAAGQHGDFFFTFNTGSCTESSGHC